MTAAQAAPLVVAGPAGIAVLLAAVGRWCPRPLRDWLAMLTAAATTALAAILVARTAQTRLVEWLGGWRPAHGVSVGIPFVVDRVGASLALLIAALVLVALFFSRKYFEDLGAHFHVLMLIFMAGMAGYVLTGDLFDMFVMFELMGTAAYALTGYKAEEKAPLQAALNFGVINSLGAYLTLSGIALLYARTGELGLAQAGEALRGHGPDRLVVAAFVLIVVGWLVKAAAVPFHFWLADAHAMAPAPVCVLFSGVMVVLGVYGTMRVYTVTFANAIPVDDVRRALLVVGLLTAFVGATMCLLQNHLKRMLAFSTIAHVGLFLCGCAVLSADGIGGTAVYVAGHAGVKAALFLCCGVLLNRFASVQEGELHGRGREVKVVGVLWMVAGLALAGLPPFGTFAGKSLAEDALVKAGYDWAPLVFVLVSAVTAGAVLRAGLRVFYGVGDREPTTDEPTPDASDEDAENEQHRPLPATPVQMVAAIAMLIAGSLAVGVLPRIADALTRAGVQFLDASDYARQALHFAHAAPLPTESTSAWTGEGVALAVLSVVMAVVIGVAAAYSERLPRLRVAPLAAGLRGFRAAHSGRLGDYVAWLLVGVAGLAALIGVPLA